MSEKLWEIEFNVPVLRKKYAEGGAAWFEQELEEVRKQFMTVVTSPIEEHTTKISRLSGEGQLR